MNKSLALGLALLFLVSCGPPIPSGYYDDFAQCLTDKGVLFYGAFWCPHCAKVKKTFGDSAQYLPYIECDPRGENSQSQRCLDAGVERYATFEFPDGSRLEGEPTLKVLSDKSGCPLPPPLP